jgi:hypothetical protein
LLQDRYLASRILSPRRTTTMPPAIFSARAIGRNFVAPSADASPRVCLVDFIRAAQRIAGELRRKPPTHAHRLLPRRFVVAAAAALRYAMRCS